MCDAASLLHGQTSDKPLMASRDIQFLFFLPYHLMMIAEARHSKNIEWGTRIHTLMFVQVSDARLTFSTLIAGMKTLCYSIYNYGNTARPLPGQHAVQASPHCHTIPITMDTIPCSLSPLRTASGFVTVRGQGASTGTL